MSYSQYTPNAVHRDWEPELFSLMCGINTVLHMDAIKKSYDALIGDGIPERFIFIVNANRSGPPLGEIFAYNDKVRLRNSLNWVREKAQICCSPDVFNIQCVDIRDKTAIGKYLNIDKKWDDYIDKAITELSQ